MSIKDRLRRLERDVGSCPECADKPQAVRAYYPQEGDAKPEPEHCPKCGRALGFVIQVVYEGEGGTT